MLSGRNPQNIPVRFSILMGLRSKTIDVWNTFPVSSPKTVCDVCMWCACVCGLCGVWYVSAYVCVCCVVVCVCVVCVCVCVKHSPFSSYLCG